MMKRDRFYKTSPHNWCGNTVMFHAINGQGYVTNIDEAHVYTREEAQKMVDDDHLRDYPNQEMPLSADHIDDLSQWRVDCQYIKKTYPDNIDPNNEYVAYKKGAWDGNDLGFSTGFGFSYNYERAMVYTSEQIPYESLEDDFDYIIVPKSHTDEIARRTFQRGNINRRKMISCAGVTGLKKKKKTNSMRLERWNCPTCGRFVWQANPYEFYSCTDENCKSFDGYLAACRDA